MLLRLHVRNLILVDTLDIEFGQGLNVLTGETGAGKSVLLEALGLALGERADTEMIRVGQSQAEVHAIFDLARLPEARHWLEVTDMASADECVLRRSIRQDGPSKAFVNGQPVTLRQLQALGEKLVLIHAQHSYQALLQRAAQQALFDAYGNLTNQTVVVRQSWQSWREHLSQWEQRCENARRREQQCEWLDFQLQTLAQLDLQPEIYSRLQAESLRLSHVQELSNACQQAQAGLDEAEMANAVRCLTQAHTRLQSVRTYAPELNDVMDLIDQAIVISQEASLQLRAVVRTLETDPVRESALADRLAAWQAAARKYQVMPEALPDLYADFQHQRQQLQGEDVAQTALAQATELAQREYEKQASYLSQLRQQILPTLVQQVNAEMQSLGLNGACFDAGLQAMDSGPEGQERVLFCLSANPGQPLTPLAKTASGGELTRVSLAIQTAAAQRLAQGPTLIFDEVDVGVGGRVAELVGRKLLALTKTQRQVICVTHQAQVAALGQYHYQVSKLGSGTHIRLLNPNERVDELARMLGGVAITAQTRAHAHALLWQHQADD